MRCDAFRRQQCCSHDILGTAWSRQYQYKSSSETNFCYTYLSNGECAKTFLCISSLCDKSPPSMCRHVMPGTVYCMPADMPPCWNAWLVCFLMCSAQHSRSVLLFCEIWFCPGLMKRSAWIQIRIVIQDFYWHHHGNSFTKKNKNNTKHTGINNTHKNAV